MLGIALYTTSKAAINGLSSLHLPSLFRWPSQFSFKFDDSSWCAGLSEPLGPELASFGVCLLLLVPGDMRTSFANIATRLVPLSDAYKGTLADHVSQAIIDTHGKQLTDLRKAAERIVEMVAGTGTRAKSWRAGCVVENPDRDGFGRDDEGEGQEVWRRGECFGTSMVKLCG